VTDGIFPKDGEEQRKGMEHEEKRGKGDKGGVHRRR
jgi:hypothetical protein